MQYFIFNKNTKSMEESTEEEFKRSDYILEFDYSSFGKIVTQFAGKNLKKENEKPIFFITTFKDSDGILKSIGSSTYSEAMDKHQYILRYLYKGIEEMRSWLRQQGLVE